jgi:hypothetical protein
MRLRTRIAIAALSAAAVAVSSAGLVLADPVNVRTGKFIEPRPCDVVGIGSQYFEYLMDQFSVNYDKALLAKLPKGDSQSRSCTRQPRPFLYSWDSQASAVAVGSPLIRPKQGCAQISRSEGIAALVDGGTTAGHPCVDFVRPSRPPRTTDPPNLTFVPLAMDNLTYASIGKSKKFRHGSNAPASLSTADLTGIYACKFVKWNQIPGNSKGSKATIHPLLPQAGSGPLASFLNAIGVTTPGPCVDEPVPFFGPGGYTCARAQRATITGYGFEPADHPGFPACGSHIAG